MTPIILIHIIHIIICSSIISLADDVEHTTLTLDLFCYC